MFLDIAWIKEKISNSAEHIKKKLPSMYHQFMQLANLDITTTPMEVGPTTHYIMGGIRVDADTQASTVPGLFAAGECASGINGANRLGGNSLSDLIVFGKRAGEYAAIYAKENPAGEINPRADRGNRADGRSNHSDARRGENAFTIQHDLQEMMQDLVGIVRTESEMQEALDGLQKLKQRQINVSVTGNIDFNPGWHTALDLQKPADRFRSDHARRPRTKRKPRRPISRRLSGKRSGICKSLISRSKRPMTECRSTSPDPGNAG